MDFYDQERNAPVVKKKTNRKAATAEKQRRENQEEVFPCQACRKLLQPALKLLRWKRRIRKKFWSIVLFSSSGQVIFVKQTNKKQFSKRSKINHKESVGKEKKVMKPIFCHCHCYGISKKQLCGWSREGGKAGVQEGCISPGKCPRGEELWIPVLSNLWHTNVR